MRTVITTAQITITTATAFMRIIRSLQDSVSEFYCSQFECKISILHKLKKKSQGNRVVMTWSFFFVFRLLMYMLNQLNYSESRSSSNTMCPYTTLNTDQFRFVSDEREQWSASTFVLAKQLSCHSKWIHRWKSFTDAFSIERIQWTSDDGRWSIHGFVQ